MVEGGFEGMERGRESVCRRTRGCEMDRGERWREIERGSGRERDSRKTHGHPEGQRERERWAGRRGEGERDGT